jgi:hypothetical protein
MNEKIKEVITYISNFEIKCPFCGNDRNEYCNNTYDIETCYNCGKQYKISGVDRNSLFWDSKYRKTGDNK